MTKKSTPVLLAGLLALTALGCTTRAEQTCEALAREQCRFSYGCCNAVERTVLGGPGAGLDPSHNTEAACVEVLVPRFCAFFNIFADGERAGRVKPDNAFIDGCLSTLRTSVDQCDAEAFLASSGLGGECAIGSFFEGQVDEGDLCFTAAECAAPGASCTPDEPRDEDNELLSAKGECESPPGEGEECPDFICAPNLFCNFETPAVCQEPKPNGEECGFDGECAEGFCDFSGDAPVCAPFKANGEPCVFGGECLSAFCDLDQDPSVCAPPDDDNNQEIDICNADEQ